MVTRLAGTVTRAQVVPEASTDRAAVPVGPFQSTVHVGTVATEESRFKIRLNVPLETSTLEGLNDVIVPSINRLPACAGAPLGVLLDFGAAANATVAMARAISPTMTTDTVSPCVCSYRETCISSFGLSSWPDSVEPAGTSLTTLGVDSWPGIHRLHTAILHP